MKRAAWLQDRRMQKFRDVLSRWERGELSMMDAGGLLGMSERQFRRYRDRYEEEGLAGLIDRRLGKVSPQRVPVADAELMLELYGGVYRGWNVRHFHEHLVRKPAFDLLDVVRQRCTVGMAVSWSALAARSSGLLGRAERSSPNAA
jgi:Helix-turn-helix domain